MAVSAVAPARWPVLTRGIAEGGQRAASVLVFGTVLFWASLYTYVPILPAYVERLSGSLQVVAWVIGAYGVTQLVLRIPLGMWSDRVAVRKPFVLAGVVAAIVSGLGLAMAHAPASLVAFRALAGTAAATWVVLTVLFSDYFTPASSHRAMTIMQVASAVGQIAAALLGGWLASSWGWTAPFYAGAVLAVLALACIAGVAEPAPPAASRAQVTAATVLRVVRLRVVVASSIIAAFAQCGFWVTVNGFTPIYAVRLGASADTLGVLAIVSLLPYAASPILGDTLLVPRVRPRHLVSAGCLVVAVATLVIPYIRSVPWLMLSQAIGGVGRGLVLPILMTCTIEAVAPRERATAMGVFQATYAVGMTLGPWLAGCLVGPLDLGGVFAATAALTGLAAGIALVALP